MKRSKSWEIDPSEDIVLQTGKGKALRSRAAIKSNEILDSFDFDDFGTPGEVGLSQGDWIKGIVNKLS